nr:MAG: hypothetical protein [Caudoviricetes sp.]
MEKMLEDLKTWQKYVSESRKELDGFPICPFAMTENINFEIISSEQTLLIQVLKKEKEGVNLFMMVDENEKLTSESAESLVKFYNSISDKYSYFVDDYNNPQYMNEVNTGNGKYIIIIAQNNNILNAARNKLKKTNYYSFLDKEYLKKIGVNDD